MVILLPLKMASVKKREDNERDKEDKGQKRQGRQTDRQREKGTNYPGDLHWALGFLYALV